MGEWHRTEGRRWQALARQVYLEETHCYRCGRYVDQTLPSTHPMSRTADHKREVHEGGHPMDRGNLALMHRRCNSAKSQQVRARRRAMTKGTLIAVDPRAI